MSYTELTRDERLAASDQAPTKKYGRPLLPANPKTCVRCGATGPTVSFVTSPAHGCWYCFDCDAERS